MYNQFNRKKLKMSEKDMVHRKRASLQNVFQVFEGNIVTVDNMSQD